MLEECQFEREAPPISRKPFRQLVVRKPEDRTVQRVDREAERPPTRAARERLPEHRHVRVVVPEEAPVEGLERAPDERRDRPCRRCTQPRRHTLPLYARGRLDPPRGPAAAAPGRREARGRDAASPRPYDRRREPARRTPSARRGGGRQEPAPALRGRPRPPEPSPDAGPLAGAGARRPEHAARDAVARPARRERGGDSLAWARPRAGRHARAPARAGHPGRPA